MPIFRGLSPLSPRWASDGKAARSRGATSSTIARAILERRGIRRNNENWALSPPILRLAKPDHQPSKRHQVGASLTIMKEFTEKADGTQAELRVGESFEISLPENPTTGHRWMLRSNGLPVCILISDVFSNENTRPGAGGVHHWKFKVVASGQALIEMASVRRWETVPPARTFRLHLRASG